MVSWMMVRDALRSARLGLSLLALLSLGAPAYAAPVSVQVSGADVRSVMLSLAQMADMGLVFDDAVSGTVSVNLTDEPENILAFVAQTDGLVLSREGDVFLVTTKEKAGSMRSAHVYRVRYGDPEDMARIAEVALRRDGDETGKVSSSSSGRKKQKIAKNPRRRAASIEDDDLLPVEASEEERPQGGDARRIQVDAATNSLVFYGTASEAAAIRNLLEEVDRPAQQVSLEAKVVALTKDASKNLGVTWEWSSLPQLPETQERIYRRGSDRESSDNYVERRYNGKDYIPGVIQFGRGPNGYPFEFYYEAKINALVTDGKAKILARPNITTVQGKEAVILIGGEVPVPTETTTNDTTRTTYDYRQTGIILRCTPRVNEKGEITAKVETEVSTPYYVDTMNTYRFQDRSAATTVRLSDGQTMVIGGLIGSEESRYMQKIPFLGDLPIIGAFFKNFSRSRQDSEVMIFLTAHVLPDT